MHRRAFTLIELLVVIAIIAILAAILFPVFAQAKAAAKATAAMSNTKQTATATIMYTNDCDDSFPLAEEVFPGYGMQAGLDMPVPANDGDTFGVGASPEVTAFASAWVLDSIQPYTKNYDLLSYTGNTSYTLPGLPFPGPAAPSYVTLTFNGDLHKYSTTAVASPSVAILFWAGNGNTNVLGINHVEPTLNCGAQIDDCMFNSGSAPSSVPAYSTQGGDLFFLPYNPTTNFNTFSNKRSPFVRTDTSAKNLPQGTATTPNFVSQGGAFSDPFAQLFQTNVGGTAYNVFSYWPCDDGQTVDNGALQPIQTYSCYFRPDRVK